jgi:AbrB family looped-hinge helix DNA binding protein
VTIPKVVREELGLREGDRVAFRVLDDGTVVVEPETVDLLTLAGAMKPKRKGISVADMNEAIRSTAQSK